MRGELADLTGLVMDLASDMKLLFQPKKLDVEALPSSPFGSPPVYSASWDGEKFSGGYGPTRVYYKDYWMLRQRSAQLFEQNLYARGMIRRLVTNEINTGLDLEATPEEDIIGREEGSLDEWSEEVENRWRIWARTPGRCDFQERRGFGRLQAAVRMESLISGDILVTLVQDRATNLPRVRLIDGNAVQTPHVEPRPGHRIVDGVELDKRGRQVAYWILQDDGTWRRLPAWGEKSGRRLAWLVYGMEKREHETRGTPMLSLVLQSLAEIDRYRDSTQRKATINSMLAMFIQKDEERLGTRPLAGAAIRRGTTSQVDSDGVERTFNAEGYVPGVVFDELQVGEKPVGFGNSGTDDKFAEFEDAIVSAMAWHFEVPPEIMRLAFSNNYSASQAAINEFKMYLNKVRTAFGEEFCKIIYQEWMVAQALTGRINAPELIASWRRPEEYDVFGAWVASEWAGHIKPSTDLIKQAKGYQLCVQEGWLSNDLASKELFGTKFTKNIKKLRRENEMKAEVMEILSAASRDAEHEKALELAEASPPKDTAEKDPGMAGALGALLEGKDVEVRYG